MTGAAVPPPPNLAMNTGDQLRALDLAAAVRDGDTDKVVEIVSEVASADDGLARLTFLLIAYSGVSVPIPAKMLARRKQQIVDEEFDGIGDWFGN